MSKSKIEWTGITWVTVTGCSDISPGCMRCYARILSWRLANMGQEKYFGATHQPHPGFLGVKWTNEVRIHPRLLIEPATWKRPQLVFVNSMSDTFHQDVPESFIRQLFQTMADNPRHTFQVLTKRADRLAEMAPRLPWPKNVWVGVSVENEDYLWRIECLRTVPAAIRFLSLEPLLGPLPNLNLSDIHWVIVGGKFDPKCRPVSPDWVGNIRDQCVNARVNLFFKQWGGTNKKAAGRVLDGRTWDEMPAGISSNLCGIRTLVGVQ